jgi:cytochrome c553
MSASELIGEMREMSAKNPPDIMDVHARAYTPAQIQAIANYLSKLPR